MSLNNIKKMQSERGFTIVELLIVIVVIGILAAIVIVAYTGVTNKANSSAAKGNAEGVQKVAETFNADKGFYAADKAAIVAAAADLTAKVPANVTIDTTVPTGTEDDKKGIHIYYQGITGQAVGSKTGGCVMYWDVNKSGGAGVVGINVGSATNAATATASACS